jgi:hypothetical protein
MLVPGANSDDQSPRALAKIRKIDVVCQWQLTLFQALIAQFQFARCAGFQSRRCTSDAPPRLKQPIE